MATILWKEASGWKTLFGNILKDVLRKDKNLEDLKDKAAARANLELTGDTNQTHSHDQRYYKKTEIDQSLNDIKKSRPINVTGAVIGTGQLNLNNNEVNISTTRVDLNILGKVNEANSADIADKAICDYNGDRINTTYAKINSPNLQGIPTAPTASTATGNDQIATTAFVQNTIAAKTTNITKTSQLQNDSGFFVGSSDNATPYASPVLVVRTIADEIDKYSIKAIGGNVTITTSPATMKVRIGFNGTLQDVPFLKGDILTLYYSSSNYIVTINAANQYGSDSVSLKYTAPVYNGNDGGGGGDGPSF